MKCGEKSFSCRVILEIKQQLKNKLKRMEMKALNYFSLSLEKQ